MAGGGAAPLPRLARPLLSLRHGSVRSPAGVLRPERPPGGPSSRWGGPMDVNVVSNSPVLPVSAKTGDSARQGTQAGDLFASMLRRTSEGTDPLSLLGASDALFRSSSSVEDDAPAPREDTRAVDDDDRAAAPDEDRAAATGAEDEADAVESREPAADDGAAPVDETPADPQGGAGAGADASADGTASQGTPDAAAIAAAAQAHAAQAAATQGQQAGGATPATPTTKVATVDGAARAQAAATPTGTTGGDAGTGTGGQALAGGASGRAAATTGGEPAVTSSGQGASGSQGGAAGTARQAQAGAANPAADAGARAAAQAERLATTVKPDTDMTVKVTVREGAAQASRGQAPSGTAEGQAAGARAAAQTPTQAASTEPTGAAALRQQALAALRQSQGDGPMSQGDMGRTTGPGAKPGIAAMNAAAAEARAEARAQLSPGQAQAPTSPQGVAEGDAGPATRAAAQGAQGTGAVTPPVGLERSGDPRPALPAGDRFGTSTPARAGAGGPAPAGARGTQGQAQGHAGGNAGGGAGAATGGTPSSAPVAPGDAGQAPGGGFADQLSRAGQGSAAEQARSEPQTRKVVEQLRVTISKAANRGLDRVSIQLHPEKLGRVDVRLDFGSDGRVSAQVTVERPETLEMLQRDGRGLERALQDAGLKTDPGGVTFALRGDGGGGAANAQDRRGQSGRAGDSQTPGGGQDPGQEIGDPDAVAMEAARARGGVNVKV